MSIEEKGLKDYFELLARQISSSYFDTPSTPYQIISGSGYGWFLDATDKKMVRIPRGTEVLKVSEKPDSKGKILVRTDFRYIWVFDSEVVDVGSN